MTCKEKVISTAYTGISFCQGAEELDAFYKYAESLLGRPVYTHEYASEQLWQDLHYLSQSDFIKVCAGEFADGRTGIFSSKT